MNDPEPAYRFVVAGEDGGHFEACSTLATRCLVEVCDWLDGNLGPGCWESQPLSKASAKAREQFSKRPGSFGSPLHGRWGRAPDARLVLAQLYLWQYSGWSFDGAVIARDVDQQPERRQGAASALDEMRNRGALRKPVVLAYADPEIEAWYVAGFEPKSAADTVRFADALLQLSFNPSETPHRLTSKRQTDLKDAKRVLDLLCDGDRGRVAACLQQPLDLLSGRGVETGLAQFIADCKTILARAVSGPEATAPC